MNQNKTTDPKVLGLSLSKFFEWDGVAIAQTSIAALRDANFHTLADTYQDALDKEICSSS